MWVAVVGAAVLIVAVGLWAVFKTDRGQEPQNPSGSECPSSAPVKGNLSGGGDKIFHEPGWTYYDKTTPEECFASVEDAEAAGYRPSAIQ
ncbi:hypothetical protein SAMN05216561_1164 [Nocardioides psychrotolerans]|uniref:Uncharacterized protein n=1 Tax=Nocardioides psychrotolerans TaxID=1005945 RepID=A0A1I3MQI2_9ACTN|nr:hypothetical protein SAMN05216561_1164 [Nocardioides psychrotolerans]